MKSALSFQKYNDTFPIYIDMSRASYELFGFPVQLGIGISTIFKAKQHFDKGFRQSVTQDPSYNKVERFYLKTVRLF